MAFGRTEIWGVEPVVEPVVGGHYRVELSLGWLCLETRSPEDCLDSGVSHQRDEVGIRHSLDVARRSIGLMLLQAFQAAELLPVRWRPLSKRSRERNTAVARDARTIWQ